MLVALSHNSYRRPLLLCDGGCRGCLLSCGVPTETSHRAGAPGSLWPVGGDIASSVPPLPRGSATSQGSSVSLPSVSPVFRGTPGTKPASLCHTLLPCGVPPRAPQNCSPACWVLALVLTPAAPHLTAVN